jgi:hypothetical protein
MSDRPTLKSYFETGDVPTEAQFAELIDSLSLTTETDAKQDTLVSGTNIKTINGESILGAGDVTIASLSVGTDGQIPFTNATGDDLDYSSSFTYTDANKQLNLIAETSANITPLLLSQENTSNQMEFQITNRNHIKWVGSQGTIYLSGRGNGLFIGGASTDASARLHVKGSGTTSATTSLLVQNIDGDDVFKVADDKAIYALTDATSNYKTKITNRGVYFSRGSDGSFNSYILASTTPAPTVTIQAAGSVYIKSFEFNSTEFRSPYSVRSERYSCLSNKNMLITADPASGSSNGVIVNIGSRNSSATQAIMSWKKGTYNTTTGTEIGRITPTGLSLGTTASTAFLHTAAATTAKASIRIEASASIDPTTPNSGDLWFDGTSLNFYDGTSTTDLLSGGGGGSSPWTTSGSDIYYDTGSVGINTGGTNLGKLHVKGSGTTSVTTTFLLQDSASDTLWLQQDIGNIGWGTSDVESWHTSFRAIEGSGSALWRSESTAAEVFIGSIANAYYPQSGGFKYKHSKGAAYIFTGSTGGIKLRTAPSGTANSSLTWVDVLHAKTNGNLNLPNLPTSASGLSAGDLWNNSGVINIV